MQLDEDRDLRAQDLRYDRLDQKIHRAEAVSAKQMGIALVTSQEEDRSALRTLPLADEFGRFKAVHLRHLDVQQNQRKIVLQDVRQSLAAGLGEHQILAQAIQDRLQRHQTRGVIVDQKDFDFR